MSNSTLNDIGLTLYESQLYELLLKLGEVSIRSLIKESKLKGSTVYSVVESLERKGLVSQRDIKKKIHVKAESPTKLVEIAKNQYESANSNLTSIRDMLPLFNSLYINSTQRPVVRVYEGIEGIKRIYEDTLKEEKFIYALLSVGSIDKVLLKWLDSYYIKKRVAKKIHANVIASSDIEGKAYKEKDTKEFRTTRIVPQKSFSLDHEINIYGDKVAFIYNADEYPLMGIVIQHPRIVSTCKSWFDLAWVGAGEFLIKKI